MINRINFSSTADVSVWYELSAIQCKRTVGLMRHSLTIAGGW